MAGPESDGCVSRCGIYVENGPPVPILSGTGLYVEDGDHNEVFLMSSADITLVTTATIDFEDVVLNASYLYDGVVQTYENGGITIRYVPRCVRFHMFPLFYSPNSGRGSACRRIHPGESTADVFSY